MTKSVVVAFSTY